MAPRSERWADVERACVEAGWVWTPEEGGGHVPFVARVGSLSARASLQPAGVRVQVELAVLQDYSAISRRAVARLLQAVCEVVPTVDAWIDERDGVGAAMLASSASEPIDRGLDAALAAMVEACDLVGLEVQALGDEGLATTYVEMCGDASTVNVEVLEEEPCLQP